MGKHSRTRMTGLSEEQRREQAIQREEEERERQHRERIRLLKLMLGVDFE